MYDDPPLSIRCPFCDASWQVPRECEGAETVCGSCRRSFIAHGEAGVPQAGIPPVPLKTSRKEAGFKLFGIGLLVLAGVALMGYFAVWEPLEKMRRHEQDVRYSIKVILFLPLFAAVGAGLLGMGLVMPWLKDRASIRSSSSTKKFLGVLFFAAMMAPGWCLYSWFKDEAAKAGYYAGFGSPPPIPVPKMDIPKIERPDFDGMQRRAHDAADAARKVRDDADRMQHR
ncbi:MAG TPA: hypothetical protein VHM91_19855 [Verrucomicrobiales bacterium]|nr:hypothetical protein [Verrucomicrobiales bacterium]